MALPRRRVHRSTSLAVALAQESALAKRLRRAGFSVDRDVRTPSRRSCDIVAARGTLRLHLHLKGIYLSHAAFTRQRLPRALADLATINRRLIVEIDCLPRLTRRALADAADELRDFLLRASLHDEHIVRDARGQVQVRCRVRAPHPGSHVIALRGIERDHERTIGRIRRSLAKARSQFLAGGENIIVAHGPERSRWLFEEALLGSPIERWDRYPRKGERVAIGRSDDGFWSGRSVEASRLAIFLATDARRINADLYERASPGNAVREAIDELFSTPTGRG